jgi:plasmid stability protein
MMPAIHVRNVSESPIAALRERAARRGHSMQQEILEILESAAAESTAGEAPKPIELVTVEVGGTGTWRRDEIYGDDGR